MNFFTDTVEIPIWLFYLLLYATIGFVPGYFFALSMLKD